MMRVSAVLELIDECAARGCDVYTLAVEIAKRAEETHAGIAEQFGSRDVAAAIRGERPAEVP